MLQTLRVLTLNTKIPSNPKFENQVEIVDLLLT